jgi:hypothetical protein
MHHNSGDLAQSKQGPDHHKEDHGQDHGRLSAEREIIKKLELDKEILAEREEDEAFN